MAQSKGLGKVLIELKDLPPSEQWANFPCCVVVAEESVMKVKPDA